MAAGKLQEWLPQRPIVYKGQNAVNLAVLGVVIALVIALVADPGQTWIVPVIAVLSLAFGVFLIIPIGGADMPTVIALLNGYAGLSAAALGIVLENKLLIVAGALDGASGIILAIIMCRAMNRSFRNVLFGAFGAVDAVGSSDPLSSDAAASVDGPLTPKSPAGVIVPGYGDSRGAGQLVAVRLRTPWKRGREVRYHSGRGAHAGPMNVLLAAPTCPTSNCWTWTINGDFPRPTVVLVLGANGGGQRPPATTAARRSAGCRSHE